jgi:hypothetical protein
MLTAMTIFAVLIPDERILKGLLLFGFVEFVMLARWHATTRLQTADNKISW